MLKRRAPLRAGAPALGQACFLCGLPFQKKEHTVLILYRPPDTTGPGTPYLVHWNHLTRDIPWKSKTCTCAETPDRICFSCEPLVIYTLESRLQNRRDVFERRDSDLLDERERLQARIRELEARPEGEL